MTKRITVRLPDELHERLTAQAEHVRRSAHAQVLVYIERGLDQDQENKGESNA